MSRINPITKNCKLCGSEFQTLDNRRVYCGHSCSGKASNVNKKPLSKKEREDLNRKIAFGVRKHYDEHPEKTPKKCRRRGRPNNVYCVSRRTRYKIVERLSLKCFVCGWNEGSCDLHHIKGRKIIEPHHHSNLCLLCPNCHRLADSGKISPESLPSFEKVVGEKWKDAYYWMPKH